MELPANVVLANGSLNDKLILKRESLYKGMNGRFVERFYLSPLQSYIFKPLTNDGQLGKEVWVHEHILPLFPAIFPKIISHSIGEHPDLNWMILEDLGHLSHEFNEETVLGVIKRAAWWHSLPLEKLGNVPTAGLKPRMEEIVSEVLGMKAEFREAEPIFDLLEKECFSNRLVLSHGDLHLGNFAVAGGRLMILDWEHTHLNVPFWDLYHVIDMSHPLFPKVVSPEFRDKALEVYLHGVEWEMDAEAFRKEYYLFSAVFSMWMISLIKKDLQAGDGKWPVERLNHQLQETVLSLQQCVMSLKRLTRA